MEKMKTPLPPSSLEVLLFNYNTYCMYILPTVNTGSCSETVGRIRASFGLEAPIEAILMGVPSPVVLISSGVKELQIDGRVLPQTKVPRKNREI